MRLLNTATRELEEFEADDIPLYSILSHTWGKDEVTLQDMQLGNATKKAGYEKIKHTCSISSMHGFEYVWIDTCCIDKTSSAELSEAINSMYRWYQESAICYAYLADVQSSTVKGLYISLEDKIRKSKWFTRGWTLQELIAPSMVIFLDDRWQEIGTKASLQTLLSEITGIPTKILQGADLTSASIAQRMSWASKRDTTRVEDIAYCLMGIFGVNMPMLYGERERAFLRLQEEIIKVSDDHSIFAWQSSESQHGLLAVSPAAFAESSKIIPLDSSSNLNGAIAMDSKGIYLRVRFTDNERPSAQRIRIAFLPCEIEGEPEKMLGIYIRAISERNEYFARLNYKPLEVLSPKDSSNLKFLETRICVRLERRVYNTLSPLAKAAQTGNKTAVMMLLERGSDPDCEDIYGQTSLSRAAECGHETIVKLLLAKGAKPSPNAIDKAATNGYERLVKILLDEGAQPDPALLLKISQNGTESIMRLLLEHGMDSNYEDSNGLTPLSAAAMKGNLGMMRLLLNKGSDLELEGRTGWTPLLAAAAGGNVEVTKLLLEQGAQPGPTLLFEATRHGHEPLVKFLLKKGAQSDQETLLDAVRNGHDKVLKILLEESSQSIPDSMLLKEAINGTSDGVVKLLVEKGAQPDRQMLKTAAWRGKLTMLKQLAGENGMLDVDVLDSAARGGQEQVVRYLLQRGIRPNNFTLWAATEAGREEITRLLLDEEGMDPNSHPGNSQTVLFSAANGGNEAVVRLLLERGADPNVQDGLGQTPLMFGTKSQAVMKVLLENGADPTLGKKSGRSLLSSLFTLSESKVRFLLDNGAQINEESLLDAARIGNESLVKLLLERGADPNGRGFLGRQPLWNAAREGHFNVVKLLLEHGARPDETVLSQAKEKAHEDILILLLETVNDDVNNN
jgi:ankyrin repeat protein